MGDRADEIARDIASRVAFERGEADVGGVPFVDAIAAALRSYGLECRNEGLEEAALYIEEKDGYWQDGIRDLKSKPESKEPTR